GGRGAARPGAPGRGAAGGGGARAPPAGTACSQDDGTACDGSGSCLAVVSVVRVGDGATALTSGVAAAVFIEHHLLSGGLLGSPIALPIPVNGANQPPTPSATPPPQHPLCPSP